MPRKHKFGHYLYIPSQARLPPALAKDICSRYGIMEGTVMFQLADPSNGSTDQLIMDLLYSVLAIYLALR